MSAPRVAPCGAGNVSIGTRIAARAAAVAFPHSPTLLSDRQQNHGAMAERHGGWASLPFDLLGRIAGLLPIKERQVMRCDLRAVLISHQSA